jgi:hypothetical protein
VFVQFTATLITRASILNLGSNYHRHHHTTIITTTIITIFIIVTITITVTITKSGAHVVTVEGIGTSKAPHPAQVRAFLQHSYSISTAFFCSPFPPFLAPFLSVLCSICSALFLYSLLSALTKQ